MYNLTKLAIAAAFAATAVGFAPSAHATVVPFTGGPTAIPLGTPVTIDFSTAVSAGGDLQNAAGQQYYNFNWAGATLTNLGSYGRGFTNNGIGLTIAGTKYGVGTLDFSAGAVSSLFSFDYARVGGTGSGGLTLTALDVNGSPITGKSVTLSPTGVGTSLTTAVLAALLPPGVTAFGYELTAARNTTWAVDNIATTVVPLPGALPLMGGGLLAAAFFRRLRRKAA